MLDVHPPHESAHSWPDFFIHIATIVVGLLIAIGLEQSVEWVHHHQELHEARQSLLLERRLNIATSTGITKEFRRVNKVLQTNLSVFLYLRQHPGTPSGQWPGKLSWTRYNVGFDDSAWQVASKGNVLGFMPHAELKENTELYNRMKASNDARREYIDSMAEASRFFIREPDAARLPPADIDHQIDVLSESLFQLSQQGIVLVNLAEHFPQFSSPSRAEIDAIKRAPSPREDTEATKAIQKELDLARDRIEAEAKE
jgi:hypothetical protein